MHVGIVVHELHLRLLVRQHRTEILVEIIVCNAEIAERKIESLILLASLVEIVDLIVGLYEPIKDRARLHEARTIRVVDHLFEARERRADWLAPGHCRFQRP